MQDSDSATSKFVAWTAPLRAELGIGLQLPVTNGAERQSAAIAEGQSITDVYASTVELTHQTFGADAPTRATEGSKP